jgi:hypothetical protein
MAQAGKATELKDFRDSIGKIRSLPPDDVIGWTKQIAQHCINCTRSNPNNIHYNWAFLPWHRALLYLSERHMRKISGNDSLRMTYWNWEDANTRTVPDIYSQANQSLYWKNRNLRPLTPSQVDVQPFLILGSFPLFGGTATIGSPTPAVFSGPHALVHNAFAPGDMADLMYSPRDPVFYAHHANIDRLWSSWTKAGHANADFGGSKAYFYDEDRKWRYILFNDLRDETRLGYEYSSYISPTVAPAKLRQFVVNAITFAMEANVLAKVRSLPSGPRYLVIEGIAGLDKFQKGDLRFGIFAKDPDISAEASKNRNFLGEVGIVGSSLPGHETPPPLTAALDVTEKMADLVEAANLSLYVAPLSQDGRTTEKGIPLTAQNVYFVA